METPEVNKDESFWAATAGSGDLMAVNMDSVQTQPISDWNVNPKKISTEMENLPFGCDLCDERFHKKLLLNNHVETRHGIKYVFTQKGQKVKLVRMPDVLHEGEKLDPCVQLLLQASDKKQRKNIIGVQAMDAPDQQINYQSQIHQEINTQELLKNKDGLGMGFLIGNITYDAIKVALSNGETPYAVFSPHNSEKFYLLSILQMNSTKQMLYPATIAELENSGGVKPEVITFFASKEPGPPKTSAEDVVDSNQVLDTSSNSEEKSVKCDDQESSHSEDSVPASEDAAGPSSNLVKRTRRVFSHVAVVALVKQVFDQEVGICTLRIEPSANHVIDKVDLCDPKGFVRHGIQCKVKRLRCFSETSALISSPPPPPKESPKPKRKYVRRSSQATSRQLRKSTSETDD